MYEVEIIQCFCAAHRLRDYQGKCEHLHGHNYRVHVIAQAPSTGRSGMVIDFGDLKKAAAAVLEKLDHSFLNEIKPFDQVEPSAENIAAFLFEQIDRGLKERSVILHEVSVWESDSCRASYIRDAD
jgi:6-pyruvoyltetrahydropterin/6-carboxytetrahydropterin synthase